MARTIIDNVSLFDSKAGVMKEGQTIVFENRLIAWVGDQGGFTASNQDTLVDGSGKYLLPGLIDCHVHVQFPFELMPNFETVDLTTKDAMFTIYMVKEAQKYLPYGVTTIRDCGSSYAGSSVRDAFADGYMVGPRMLVAQEPLRQWGDQEMFGNEAILSLRSNEVISGPDGVRHAVRERIRLGSDFIKTMTTGGVLHGKRSLLDRSLWDQEELNVMVDEAERMGIYVAAHAHTSRGIHAAVIAGVRTIEHGTQLEEETMDEMIRRGSYLVATHSPQLLFSTDTAALLQPEEVISKANRMLAIRDEHHQLAREKGVKIALGTDAPVGAAHSHSTVELELYVKNLGMTTAQALQSATSVAAEAIRMDTIVGNLDVGKAADAVLLTSNPLDDISILQDPFNIESVFKEGKKVASFGKIAI